MAVTPTYPGVYIEEIPSGVRTITGVATSITGFVGRALQGPVDEPVRIQSFAEFERIFGGLWIHSTMSYAVRQYFLNGGTDAIIVRVVDRAGLHASLTLPVSGSSPLVLEAVEVGEAGNNLEASISVADDDPDEFDITIADTATETSGTLTGTTINDIADDLTNDEVLSALVTIRTPSNARPDNVESERATGGLDPASAARITLAQEYLVLEAVHPGDAGNNLVATVSDAESGDVGAFDITITNTATGETGTLAATTINSIDEDLAGHDTLPDIVAIRMPPPGDRPDNTTAPVSATGGDSGEHAILMLPRIGDALSLVAANEGAWGGRLEASIDHETRPSPDATLFNLRVEDTASSAVETFRNVSLDGESPRLVSRILEQESVFVRTSGALPAVRPAETPRAVSASGGSDGAAIGDADVAGSPNDKTGIYALEDADLFNLLCLPPLTRETDVGAATYEEALAYCRRRRAMLLVDPPGVWNDVGDITNNETGVGALGLTDENAMMYFPRIRAADPLQENRLEEFVPCGAVAGIIARTDVQRGVWKAPAGLDARIVGARELSVKLTDNQNGQLNPLGVNCLRTFPVVGSVVWGARTLEGADRLASEWKYIPVRRVTLFIEESLYRGTQWVVFEPNDEPLWAQIRLNVGAFMQNLFRQGAFQGTTPKDAYFVKCDSETTTQNDINRGVVNVLVGFAPLKPAEFVIIQIQQIAGSIET